MAYPSVYPLSRPIVPFHSLPAGSPSRSIHVGAPSVNIDVQTTRHRIAHHNLEKQVSTPLFTYTSAQMYKISILIRHEPSWINQLLTSFSMAMRASCCDRKVLDSVTASSFFFWVS